ncbi:hypothetical protein KP77_10210 [Jeotgalibacillus alimentarius]|uniref:Uncharacterized protein n=1 Tax=Jeotgalibacillus alimentarius TaxID=135826 RepID=A0A0C2SC57_9BACL|nr:hypothetical protein KP77_10210 [Jeotgalibacillus alimentarius]
MIPLNEKTSPLIVIGANIATAIIFILLFSGHRMATYYQI